MIETPMEARWLAYLGSGLLAALSLAPTTWFRSAEEVPAPTQGREAAPDEPNQALVDVERQAQRLRRHLIDAPAPRDPGRNPFRYGQGPVPGGRSRPPRVAPTGAAEVRAPEGPAEGPAQLSPSLPSIRLVGMVEDGEGESVVRTAVISAFGNVHLVRVGDLLAERFSVTAIGADAVELLDTTTQQVLRLGLRP